MATFKIRQKLVYFEDFIVEADTPEDAIDSVNAGDETGDGPEYLEATETYLLSEDGVYAALDQPRNAYIS